MVRLESEAGEIMTQAKTIIITQLPNIIENNNVSFCGFPKTVKMASLLSQPDGDESNLPPRKRQRLNHLSVEEKVLRRKLKNRVAAQTARDRKKVRMQELEDEVQMLTNKNSELKAQNESLQQRNTDLEKENQELRQRLGLVELEKVTVKKEPAEPVEEAPVQRNDDCRSVEYASLISDPLQKGQDQVVIILWTMLLAGWLMSSLTSSLMSCKNSVESSKLIPSAMQTVQQSQMIKLEPMLKWWGPHQRSWNPSKNS